MLNRMVQVFKPLGDVHALPPEAAHVMGCFIAKKIEGSLMGYSSGLIHQLEKKNVDTTSLVVFKNICDAVFTDYLGLIKLINAKHVAMFNDPALRNKYRVPSTLSADDLLPLLFGFMPKFSDREEEVNFCRQIMYFCNECPATGIGEMTYYLTVLESYAHDRLFSPQEVRDRDATLVSYTIEIYNQIKNEFQQQSVQQLTPAQNIVLSAQSLQSLKDIMKFQQAIKQNQQKIDAERDAKFKAEQAKKEAIQAQALEKQKRAAEKYSAQLGSILKAVQADYLRLLDTYECDMDNELRKNPTLHAYFYPGDCQEPLASRILHALVNETPPVAPVSVQGQSKIDFEAKQQEHQKLIQARAYVAQNEVLKSTIVKIRATRHVLSAANLKGKTTEQKLIETSKRIETVLHDKEVVKCRDSKFKNLCKRALVAIGSVVGLGKKLEKWLFKPNSVKVAEQVRGKIQKANPSGFFTKKQHNAQAHQRAAVQPANPQQQVVVANADRKRPQN